MALFADAALSVAAVAGEVEMEVVAMAEVIGRAEHGGEYATGAAMHVAQNVAFGQAAPPAGLDVHHASVGEHKPRDVDRVGMAVLGQAGAVDVVHGPARVGGSDSELDHLDAQVIARSWNYHPLHPPIDRRYHRASQQGCGL